VEDILGNIILRNIQKRKVNGFVRVDDNMDITHKWMFDNIFFCGEPIAVRLNNKNGLIAFGNNDNITNDKTTESNPGGIVLLNMEDGTIIKLLVNDSLTMGFHTVSITR
jgi:hypothetical protein